MASRSAADLEAVREWLGGKVSPPRLFHSEGVLISVTELAEANHLQALPLRLAALIHDCARELSDKELLGQADELGLPVRDVDRGSPVLLHGRVGMEMARRELGIDDPVADSAVRFHTAGHPDMSLSDKLFFLADHVEPGRDHARVDELRELAAGDVDAAVMLAVEINIDYLRTTGKTIDPDTLALRAKLAAE